MNEYHKEVELMYAALYVLYMYSMTYTLSTIRIRTIHIHVKDMLLLIGIPREPHLSFYCIIKGVKLILIIILIIVAIKKLHLTKK